MSFFEQSKTVASDFIKSVLFVDDQIEWNAPSENHELNASAIVRSFSDSNKSCSFFNYIYATDDEKILNALNACDGLVLDWKIKTACEAVVNDIDSENDATEQDGRGKITIELLKKIIQKESYSPIVVIILTGETGGSEIFQSIKNALRAYITYEHDDNELALWSDFFRITVYFKPHLTGGKVDQHYAGKVLSDYSDLPKKITEEFAKLTSGLMSNFALKSISDIRNNTNRLLRIYNKTLDPAYLAHRAMLSNPEDAENLVKEIFLSSISSIFTYSNVVNNINYSSIEKYINEKVVLSKDVKIDFGNKKDQLIPVDKENMLLWQKRGYTFPLRKLVYSLHNHDISDAELEAFDKWRLSTYALKMFDAENSSRDFAILTHHKSNLLAEGYKPFLSLGTVVKGVTTNRYLLCIQQKCDCVRISEGEERRFLFLPLEIVERPNIRTDILFYSKSDFIKLKISAENCHQIRTIKFKATNKGIVEGIKDDGDYFFTPEYYKEIYNDGDIKQEKFHWILDLKDAHAQRILNKYSATISRVGLDESEWLRRL